MKYPPQIYATAFLEVLEKNKKDEPKIRKRFLEVLKKNGDIANFGKIAKEMQKILAAKNGGKVVEIEFARPLSKKLEDKVRGIFSEKDFVSTKHKSELLAGARILINGGKELDFSFQRKLRKLFS
ncbi:hypothetical protein A3B18_00710 [Candidatus Giovannonibacteria bacterium RIFCSPLOWO2_01_FULL_46_13]|uniref:Uncharacterized protein n=1 Tax=Candidatus Giovannonibacteria bacterium RIFCSPLOWO2_01_FULL_46_13 TaxID=1798352 RepID=A0A1F5X3M1_9BACT|nr:MAG: hypothetical protein A3B18_00710 [Candidatus Giovannonibacteria bacterium RIFCSPLOWO2_01_FULL_46_13]